jgi:hypothetical protein
MGWPISNSLHAVWTKPPHAGGAKERPLSDLQEREREREREREISACRLFSLFVAFKDVRGGGTLYRWPNEGINLGEGGRLAG